MSTKLIDRLTTVHGSRYDYSQMKFSCVTEPVNIVCSVHGVFSMTTTKHLGGSGCPKCGKKDISYRDKAAWLYYIRIGNHYKIGVTIDIAKRIEQVRKKAAHKVTLIASKKYESRRKAFVAEWLVKHKHSHLVVPDTSELCDISKTEIFTEDIFDTIKAFNKVPDIGHTNNINK